MPVSDPDWFDEEPTDERGARPREQPARMNVFGPTPSSSWPCSSSSARPGPAQASTCGGANRSASQGVFLTEWGTRALLFVGGFVLHRRHHMATTFTWPTAPLRHPDLDSASQQTLEQYRQVLHPVRRLALIGIPSVLGLLAGMERGGHLADVPAVAQRCALRPDERAVRDRHRLLRLRCGGYFLVSLVTLVLVLALMGTPVHALPVWRVPVAGPRRPRGRHSSRSGSWPRCSRSCGGRLLAGPVLPDDQ